MKFFLVIVSTSRTILIDFITMTRSVVMHCETLNGFIRYD